MTTKQTIICISLCWNCFIWCPTSTWPSLLFLLTIQYIQYRQIMIWLSDMLLLWCDCLMICCALLSYDDVPTYNTSYILLHHYFNILLLPDLCCCFYWQYNACNTISLCNGCLIRCHIDSWIIPTFLCVPILLFLLTMQ